MKEVLAEDFEYQDYDYDGKPPIDYSDCAVDIANKESEDDCDGEGIWPFLFIKIFRQILHLLTNYFYYFMIFLHG